MNSSRYSYILSILLFLLLSSPTAVVLAKDPEKPAYSSTQLFINNHRSGAENGCSGGFGEKGCMTCGHTAHVSEVTWTFLRRSSAGDIYKVTRKYPADTATAEVNTKEVTYAGKEIMVWEDDYQKVIIRPQPSA